MQERESPGGNVCGRGCGVGLGGRVRLLGLGGGPAFSLFCWENGLSSNTDSNRIGMELGDQLQSSAPSAAGWMGSSTNSTMTSPNSWKRLNRAVLINSTPDQKVVLWQRFETFRNRLPLVDHHLIADAEATDLAETYCSATLIRFLVQVLQLSPGEAASRVRAAAAVGPRRSMLGEQLEPVLPRLAALQRAGVVSVEKVQIVERAMHKLTRPGLHPDAVEMAEQLLTQYAPRTRACGVAALRPQRG